MTHKTLYVPDRLFWCAMELGRSGLLSKNFSRNWKLSCYQKIDINNNNNSNNIFKQGKPVSWSCYKRVPWATEKLTIKEKNNYWRWTIRKM